MLMILTYITNIGKIFELTLGQGHKVKGQGQTCKRPCKSCEIRAPEYPQRTVPKSISKLAEKIGKMRTSAGRIL